MVITTRNDQTHVITACNAVRMIKKSISDLMKKQLRNYGIYLIGLFIASFGLALSTKAGLGTSPVASVA